MGFIRAVDVVLGGSRPSAEDVSLRATRLDCRKAKQTQPPYVPNPVVTAVRMLLLLHTARAFWTLGRGRIPSQALLLVQRSPGNSRFHPRLAPSYLTCRD